MTARYEPLDVWCTDCKAPPQRRCRSLVIEGRPYLRRPHASRVTAARLASEARSRPRAPAVVSDAWTCPTCSRSYWPPREWEAPIWPAARDAAQRFHARLHAEEARDATTR